MNQIAIVHCKCQNRFQDKTYGKNIRVTTPDNNEQAKKQFVVRCTVCGSEHNLGQMK